MNEFAVRVEGEDEHRGYWVLALDMERDRLLISTPENRLRWVRFEDCYVIKAINPEMPRPIMVVQPQSPITMLDPRKLKADGGRKWP